MKEITEAITARQAQIKTLQSDIDALQRAASVLGGKTTAKKATGQPKTTGKRRQWSAAARAAMSRKVKASWAKRKKARR